MVLFSLECSGCKATLTSGSNFLTPPIEKETAAAVAKNEPNRMIKHVNGRICPPSSPSNNRHHEEEEKKKKNGKTYRNKIKMVSSDDDSSDIVHVCVPSSSMGSNCDSKATAILTSTSFFSSDSAEYYTTHPSSSGGSSSNNKKKIKNKCTRPTYKRRDHYGSTRHGKKIEEMKAVNVGMVAVERRSMDLYGDFRLSMVEMIMAANGKGDMNWNWLLESYISLNSPEHYPVIIRAFSDIVYKGSSLHQIIMATK